MKRRGQALMEMAVGMLALTLVVCFLCGIVGGIVKSLKEQNELRKNANPPWKIDKVELPKELTEMFK